MFKPLRPILGPDQDAEREMHRRIAERVQRRSTLHQTLPWTAERPGGAFDMTQSLLSSEGHATILEAIIARGLDQDIDGDEMLYLIRELAAKYEDDQKRAHEEDAFWGRR